MNVNGKLKRILSAAFFALAAVASARAETAPPDCSPGSRWSLERGIRALREGDEWIAEQAFANAALIDPGCDVGRYAQASARLGKGFVRTSAAATEPRRIGYVASAGGPTFEAFRQGLRDVGLVEGRDVVVEARFTEGRQERFPALVDELLKGGVQVLLAGSPPGAVAALKAETTTPIVIAGVTDPHGVARALGRPHAHVTGMSVASRAVGGGWVDMLKQAVPQMTRVAVLANPAHRSRDRWVRDIREAAERASVQVDVHDVADAAALDAALAAISAGGAQGLIVTGEPAFLLNRAKIISFADSCGLPAIYFSKIFADSGGLMAYGGSLEESYGAAPRYIKAILEGAQPSELPVRETRVELVVNQRAARTLGIAIPQEIVRRADQVID